MAFFRGQQGTVFFDKAGSGGLSEIAAVRSWSMTVEKESYDATSHGATYRANIGGLISGSGTIEVMYDAPGSGDKLDLIKDVNQATDEHKEEIKIGYNIQRKIVLMAIWVGLPFLFWFQPAWGEALNLMVDAPTWFDQVGWSWLMLGIAGLLFRVGQLWIQRDLTTGLVWASKIITDPFHDVMLYHKSPLYLLKGELIDPMLHVNQKH